MEFNYYYGNQADQFSFIRIPWVLLVDQLFAPLSIQAKLLYGVFLDRMGISMRNGWFDEKNWVYIIYQISEIQDDLGFSKKKAIDYLTELEQFGLVEKKRRGRGLPSILYIKSFMSQQVTMSAAKATMLVAGRSAKNDTSEGFSEELRSAQIDTSIGTEIALQEVPESTLLEAPESTPLKNNNKNNYTYMSYIPSNQILSSAGCETKRYDEMDTAKEMIKDRIEYDYWSTSRHLEMEMIDCIVEIMLEVELNQSQNMRIASATYPTSLVRERFAKINSEHIQYVLDCFNANTTRVGNIKKYLMTVLFNAPTTIDGYYTAAVHHDMPYLASAKIGG